MKITVLSQRWLEARLAPSCDRFFARGATGGAPRAVRWSTDPSRSVLGPLGSPWRPRWGPPRRSAVGLKLTEDMRERGSSDLGEWPSRSAMYGSDRPSCASSNANERCRASGFREVAGSIPAGRARNAASPRSDRPSGQCSDRACELRPEGLSLFATARPVSSGRLPGDHGYEHASSRHRARCSVLPRAHQPAQAVARVARP
jgi:hypothetical protein